MLDRTLEDVTYAVERSVAWITIDRPDRLNAFRGQTIDELIHCFKLAWGDASVGVVVLTGSGDRAFCVGGDQKQRQETGDYGPNDYNVFQDEYLQRLIRDIPKPVIAAVNGFAIGGGHVLHVVCDLTIAADHAQFGQAGPRVGSYDAGFGTAYLARVIGGKRAREVWMLCRRYSAQTMFDWGLVNAVVPFNELHDEVRRWSDEILALSPTALKVVKHSFNADTESIAGISSMAFDSLGIFVQTDEAREGVDAFVNKEKPDFGRYR